MQTEPRQGEIRCLRDSVESHYDSLAFLYRAFWGEHIHHGLWTTPDEPLRGAPERLVEYLSRRACIERGERVLDVGCGYGAAGRWLASRLACDVTGITISAGQARVAKRRNARETRAGSTNVVRADAVRMPFLGRAFDVIWVIECIEHLAPAGKERFFQESARLLRPGGRLALCTWEHGDVTPGRDGSQPGRLVAEVSDRFLCPSLASAAEYTAWCEAAGLAVSWSEDLTAKVERTWDVLLKRVRRPWLQWLKPWVSPTTRRFVEGFPVIREAYATGAMKYGLLIAEKRRSAA